MTLVKERADIADVVSDHVTLRNAAATSRPLPLPRREDPVLQRAPERRSAYHCFGCAESGDVISFVMEIDHLPFSGRRATRLARGHPAATGRRRLDARPQPAARLVEAHRSRRNSTPELLTTPAAARPAVPGARGFDSSGRPLSGWGTRPGRLGPGPAPARKAGSRTTRWSPGDSPDAVRAGSTTGSGAGWSGRSGTSPVTAWGSERAGSTTTTGSSRSTSTPPRRRSTRSPRCSTASTPRRRRSAATGPR